MEQEERESMIMRAMMTSGGEDLWFITYINIYISFQLQLLLSHSTLTSLTKFAIRLIFKLRWLNSIHIRRPYYILIIFKHSLIHQWRIIFRIRVYSTWYFVGLTWMLDGKWALSRCRFDCRTIHWSARFVNTHQLVYSWRIFNDFVMTWTRSNNLRCCDS